MMRYPQEEIDQVLGNLQTRFPHATEADAIAILENDDRCNRAEAEMERREQAQIEADLDAMGEGVR